MRSFKYIVPLIAAVLLGGCAALQQASPFSGLDKPETPVEVLGYVEATRAAVARSATESLEAGRIDVDMARDIDESLDDVNHLSDTAATMLAEGDEEGASNKLSTAQSILSRIEQRLAEAANE